MPDEKLKLVAEKLKEKLTPDHLDVIDESPDGSGSYVKVIVVTSQFKGKPLLERHKMVNSLLADELKTSIHALTIEARTPEEWKKVAEKRKLESGEIEVES
uniref:BolA-like protein n=1 Tax=Clastoptera arizonana TaxID=38151 RepID=A0A1B6CQ43_9HEMI